MRRYLNTFFTPHLDLRRLTCMSLTTSLPKSKLPAFPGTKSSGESALQLKESRAIKPTSSLPHSICPALTTGGEGVNMHQAVVVDGDGHVMEPEDLWLRYLEPQWRDRAIRIARDAQGIENLLIDQSAAPLHQEIGFERQRHGWAGRHLLWPGSDDGLHSDAD
jgi:hypothetical protein